MGALTEKKIRITRDQMCNFAEFENWGELADITESDDDFLKFLKVKEHSTLALAAMQGILAHFSMKSHPSLFISQLPKIRLRSPL